MPAAYTEQLTDVTNFTAVGWRQQYCGIKTLLLGKVRYYFIDNLYYFGRDGLYGYADDGERFAFFQLALCEMMARFDLFLMCARQRLAYRVRAGFVADKYQWINDYRAIKTVLTIHNLRFQGVFDPVVLSDLFGIGMAT
ncbi:glycogen/starch synthase [Lactiplantibacillus plantarum]|uniref:glycogen/starch synthase n=1 Tax=Lactiplantibacillus plantarum TaxID=1590 RepID=UPI00132C4D41|nr:glycogen/starch synthase [Lactiplantibacillus plantarum]KAE9506519.1 Glycogen synthase [Lactiplantibacillus plantarum]